jgi:3-oxoacyl-[acyl-carrier protein] reductase
MESQAVRRVGIVTGAGATGGLGKAIALALARAGNVVVVNDLDEGSAGETAERLVRDGHEALGVAANVTDGDAVGRMLETVLGRYGRVDILVNTAGTRSKALVGDLKPEEIDAVLAGNLKSVILCTNAVAPVMKRQRYGRIVSIGSSAGRCGGGEFMTSTSLYSAGKAGIGGFSRSAARELGPFGITVNLVAPFLVDVPGRSHGRPPDVLEEMLRRIPMRRLATPDDIAAAVVFLGSEAAGYITGVELDVNGGFHMGA